MPVGLVSDRGTQFTADFWQALFKSIGTRLRMSTAHHAETDGQSERAIRSLISMLRAYVSERSDDWPRRLAAAEYVYNDSLQASTGYSPFFLNYGQDPLAPADLLNSKWSASRMPAVESASSFVAQLMKDIDAAKKHLAKAQARQTAYANKRRRPHSFAAGQQVLLSTKYLLRTDGEVVQKLRARWEGPFDIVAMVGPNAARLDLPSEVFKIHPVVNVEYLRPYHNRVVSAESEGEDAPVASDSVEPAPVYYERGTPLWNIEKVLDRRVHRKAHWRKFKGKPRWFPTLYKYKVRWQGYSVDQDSWELRSQFRDEALRILDEYDAERNDE